MWAVSLLPPQSSEIDTFQGKVENVLVIGIERGLRYKMTRILVSHQLFVPWVNNTFKKYFFLLKHLREKEKNVTWHKFSYYYRRKRKQALKTFPQELKKKDFTI